MEKNVYKLGVKGLVHDADSAWNMYPKFLNKIRLNTTDKVLDAGCGEGKIADYLKNSELYGFDYSKEALKKAKKRGYKKAMQGDMKKIPFKKKEFDVSISLGVLQYLEEPHKSFEELIRVTKKRIAVSSANFEWFRIKSVLYPKFRKKYNWLIENENFINERFLRQLAKKYGLPVEVSYISNRFEKFRNLFGKYLASEVVAIYNLK